MIVLEAAFIDELVTPHVTTEPPFEQGLPILSQECSTILQ